MLTFLEQYREEDPGPEGGSWSGGAAVAEPSEDAGNADLPERQRLAGENARLRSELNKLKTNTRIQQPTVPANGTVNASNEPTIDDLINQIPEETWLDPKEAARQQAIISQHIADRQARLRAAEAQRNTEVQATQVRRQERTDANVERFKQSRDWTEDGDKWQAFANHMNTVFGQGELGEITYDQLVAQERAFRGDELINEALSEGQRRTVETISGADRTRTSRGRGNAVSINDMSLEEQIEAINDAGGPDGDEAAMERAFYSIKDEKRRDQILSRIDSEV